MATRLKVFRPPYKPINRVDLIKYLGFHPAHGQYYAHCIKHDALPYPTAALRQRGAEILSLPENPLLDSIWNYWGDKFEADVPGYAISQEGRSGGWICLVHKPGPGMASSEATTPDYHEIQSATKKDLQSAVNLLWAFDSVCDKMWVAFLEMCANYEVREVSQTLTRKIKILCEI